MLLQAGESPLQIKLHELGKKLGIVSLSASVLVFVIGLTTGIRVDLA